MIPRAVTICVRHRGRPIHLWLPALPVLVLLAPVVALGLAIAGWARRPAQPVAGRAPGPARVVAGGAPGPGLLGASWRLMCALAGTRIEIQRGRTAVLVTIR